MAKDWFPLDHAATLYPGVISGATTGVYRVAANLETPPSPEAVKRAAERAAELCPFFRVRVRDGLFWHFLERTDASPAVREEDEAPCRPFRADRDGELLWRVLLRDGRVSLEMSHILADGHGALELLRLILLFLHCENPTEEQLALPPLSEAAADAYRARSRELASAGSAVRRLPKAWRWPGGRLPRGMVRFTRIALDAGKFLAIAREKGVSLGEWTAALVLETLLKEQEALRERRRPVRLLVPVDIRGMLSSRTMRNAFLTVAVGIDPKLGPWSFDEILNEVHHTMRLRRARPHIAPVLTSSLKAQSNPFLRPIPSLFKDRILRLVHRNRASKRYTALLSNLGDVKWDFDGAEGIRDLEMVPNPNPVAGLQLGLVGWRGRLVLGCASLLPAPWFERDLMRALQRYETHLEVEANWC